MGLRRHGTRGRTLMNLKKLELLGPLAASVHEPGSVACVMEAVAFVAGEPWSDNPQCACPLISAFLRGWNDSLPTDAERDRLLRPLVPRLIGTKADFQTEKKRSLMALEWL